MAPRWDGRPIRSVFLIILYHKSLWIFLIYSLYIPYVYIYIFIFIFIYIYTSFVHISPFVCFVIYSANRFKSNFLINRGVVAQHCTAQKCQNFSEILYFVCFCVFLFKFHGVVCLYLFILWIFMDIPYIFLIHSIYIYMS